MTDYTEIPDDVLEPGDPITSQLLTLLRNNPLAMFEGASGAPQLNRKAISAGGTGVDGDWVNGSTISGLGYHEPSSILFTNARSLPGVTIARVNGDVRISNIITLDRISAANALRTAKYLHGVAGTAGTDAASGVAMAGANLGNGGEYAAPAAYAAGIDVTGLNRPWYGFRPWVGGKGGDITTGVSAPYTGGLGGGSLILLVEGDVDCSSGTIRCNGDAGGNGAGGDRTGAGAGGSIIIACTGTLTGGTYEAKGGAGASGATTFGGGGGYVALIAPTFAGSRTKTVTGGAGNSGGLAGQDGYAEEVTLTAEVIRGLMMRSI